MVYIYTCQHAKTCNYHVQWTLKRGEGTPFTYFVYPSMAYLIRAIKRLFSYLCQRLYTKPSTRTVRDLDTNGRHLE